MLTQEDFNVCFDNLRSVILKQDSIKVIILPVLPYQRKGAEVTACCFCVAYANDGIRFTFRKFKVCPFLPFRIKLSFPFNAILLVYATPGNRIHYLTLFTVEFCCKAKTERIIEIGLIVIIQSRADYEFRFTVITKPLLKVPYDIMDRPTGSDMQFNAVTDLSLPVVGIVLLPYLIKPVTVQCCFDTVDKVIAVQKVRCTDFTGITAAY